MQIYQSNKLNMVTGALSYTGKYITKRLLSKKEKVRTLTVHPGRENPFGQEIEFSDRRLLFFIPEGKEDKDGKNCQGKAGHAGKCPGESGNQIRKQGEDGIRTAKFTEGDHGKDQKKNTDGEFQKDQIVERVVAAGEEDHFPVAEENLVEKNQFIDDEVGTKIRRGLEKQQGIGGVDEEIFHIGKQPQGGQGQPDQGGVDCLFLRPF